MKNQKYNNPFKIIKNLKEKQKNLEQDIIDLKNIINTEVKRCESCGHLDVVLSMSYVGNHLICESCQEAGFGR